jgi:hypothetical protein
MRAQFSDWITVLGDHNGLAGTRNLVHQREALRLKFRSSNSGHAGPFETQMTISMPMVTKVVNSSKALTGTAR